MNILDSIFYIKKSKNVVIKKEDKGIIIENISNEEQTIIIPKVFKFTKEYINISFKGKVLKGEGIVLKIVNRKRTVVGEVQFNTQSYLKRPTKYGMFALRIRPETKIKIIDSNMEEMDDYQEKLEKFCKSNILLMSPGYPSEENKYACAFVHTRVKAYKGLNWKIDVISVGPYEDTIFYEFEGVKVCQTNFSNVRVMLQNKKYEKILIHFFNENFANILDSVDTSDTKIYLYSHGADTMYRDFNKMTATYFNQPLENTLDQERYFRKRDKILFRYNDMPNVKWFFVTDWTRRHSEELNNIKYKNYEIVPCLVDEKIFKFEQKDPELRKKIFIIRKFDNINTYSIDIDVRTILELSRRPFFDDLEFNIYGQGSEHEILLAPIRKFKNVHIYNKFLSHDEIAKAHKENGIALFATRYDSQAVSSCEAAMSGLVVVSSMNPGVIQEINPEYGTLCDTENYKEYADKIEELYNNPELFVNLSKKMHDFVYERYCYEKTIQKELDIFKKDENIEIKKMEYKEQDDEIILTIAIPSYNVGKFLKNGVYSLINHKLSNKLEILIVNDGSKDNTAEVGRELEELTKINGKSIVKLVDKENGGHGSTINKGIELARGKYFKLMDGDDYFDTEELVKLIQYLENEDTDIILNNYVEDLALETRKNTVKHYEFMIPGLQYDIEDLCYPGYGFRRWGPLLSTSTYRTQMLKDGNFKISEKCFYVDMELNTFAFINAKTVKYYPLDIYVYYIGRVGQSISRDSYTKHYKDHEKVTLRLLEELYNNKKVTENKKGYLKEHIILPLVEAQYYITTEYLNIKEPFRYLDENVKKHPEIYNNPMIASKRTRFHRKTNGNLINAMHFYDKVRGFLKH